MVKMMRINKISMFNYRQYKEETIHFNLCSPYDLHIVIGDNGSGKTNLLNAINWCLYNDEPHLGNKSKALPIVNLNSLDSLEEGEICEVKVEITCENENGILTFRRIGRYRKCGKGEAPFQVEVSFDVSTQFDDQDTNVYTGDEVKQWLDRFVPFNIREYFFFDGERLDRYFINESNLKIKDSVFEISQIKLLSNVRSKLEIIIKDLYRDETKNKPDVDMLRKVYEETDEKLNAEIQNITILQNEINVSEQIIIECDEFLRGEPDIQEIEANRKVLLEELERKKSDVLQKQKDYASFIKKSFILINTHKSLKKSKEIIDNLQKNGSLPPNMDKNYLKSMLSGNDCKICGNPLSESSIEQIQGLINEIEVSSPVSHILVKMDVSLTSFLGNYGTFKNDIESIMRDLSQHISDRDKIQANIDALNHQISGYKDREKIIEKHNDRMKHSNLKNDNLRKQGLVSARIVALASDLATNKEKLNNAIKKNGVVEDTTKQRIFAEKAKQVAELIEKKLLDEIRNKIQHSTETLFLDLIWKKLTFKKVILDDSYSLSLIHMDDYECLGSCSAAERALFALSFTLGIHKESGFSSPLIIDTPVARISGKNRSNFVEALGKVSKDKQIILFFTPDEYSTEVKGILEPLLCIKQTLNANNEVITTIN